jgi:transposase-like protein
MLRRIGYAMRNVTSATRHAAIPGAGHYERKLQTKAGEVKLRIPKLRTQTFETAIIERYRRRESSVEEALIEMYLAGVSVRRVEDITEALWGTRVSPSTVSDLNKKIYGTIETWRNRPIEDEHPYVYLDGIVLRRSWAGEVRNVSLCDRGKRPTISRDSWRVSRHPSTNWSSTALLART